MSNRAECGTDGVTPHPPPPSANDFGGYDLRKLVKNIQCMLQLCTVLMKDALIYQMRVLSYVI